MRSFAPDLQENVFALKSPIYTEGKYIRRGELVNNADDVSDVDADSKRRDHELQVRYRPVIRVVLPVIYWSVEHILLYE